MRGRVGRSEPRFCAVAIGDLGNDRSGSGGSLVEVLPRTSRCDKLGCAVVVATPSK